MRSVRILLLAALLVAALVLQISVFPHLAVAGVVPDVVGMLVVAVALAEGPRYASGFGLLAGLVLDLAPPAEHTVGRWALAFVLIGYLAGLVRQDAARSVVGTAVTAAACSFIATSVFAISGMLLEDPGVTVGRVIGLLPLVVVYDVAVALALVPLVGGWLARLRERDRQVVR